MFLKKQNIKLLERKEPAHILQYLRTQTRVRVSQNICHQALDSPAKVAAEAAVPGDVAPPPAGPLHLSLLHSRHSGGWSFHLLGRGRRPARWLLHRRRLLLLLLAGDSGNDPLPDKVDLTRGRHPLRFPLASPVVLVH